jgi:hypothetical protein
MKIAATASNIKPSTPVTIFKANNTIMMAARAYLMILSADPMFFFMAIKFKIE